MNCEVQALCIVLICMFQGDSCHFPVGRGWEKSLEEKFLFKSKPGTSHTHLPCSHPIGELSHMATTSCKGGWEV